MLKYYNEKIFYRLMNQSLGQENITQMRRELLANAGGEVLEIGFGTGLNLACYPDRVRSVTANDVCRFKARIPPTKIQLRRLVMSAEAMTFPDGTFDTVVSTFTLCSIPRVQAALHEIQRVLKPGGEFLFLEHGKSPNPLIAGLQNLANPLYNLLARGCNNRNMIRTISASGLCVQWVKTGGSSLLIASYYLSGIATKTGAPW